MNVKQDKKNWIAKLKEKLATNWISNLVAILAFAISIIALCVSFDANKIAKTVESPYFKLTKNFDIGRDEISIYNEGGKLRELENPRIYLFWSITSDKTLRNAKEIVVLNYYNLGSRDPLLSGKTPMTISAENPTKAESLIDGFKKLAKENSFLVFLSAKWYVRLQYKDIYDESHDDMYDVSYVGCRKMSKNEAVKLIRKYNQKIAQGMVIDMSSASPEILYGKWKN